MATETERRIIQQSLFDLADDKHVRPLAARDYGSRARNIESESSDYDVFFVFTQPPAAYVVGSERETIDTSIDADETDLGAEIEFHGWNLSRFIGNDGVVGSNPTAIEFAASPEEYFMRDKIADQMEWILGEAQRNFKPYALMNHYRSMAASNYGKYIEGDYKLTDDTSWDDLVSWSKPDWGWIAEDAANMFTIDEQDTHIGQDTIDFVGKIEWDGIPAGTLNIDRALEHGLVEETTIDNTVKRYLNIMQALMKARLIEETHELPPMDANELLRIASDYEWIDAEVYAMTGDLIAKKVNGRGSETVDMDILNEWIESELQRDIDPEIHVKRTPMRHTLYKRASRMYNETYNL